MAADQPNRTRRYVYGGLLAAAAVAIGLALVFTVGQKKETKAATAPSVASLDDHTPIEDVLKDLAPKPVAPVEPVAVTPVAPVVEEPAPGVATSTFTQGNANSFVQGLSNMKLGDPVQAASLLPDTAQQLKQYVGTAACWPQDADELKHAVEEEDCPLVVLTNGAPDAYALEEAIEVTRSVRVVGNPSILPTIDGSEAERCFTVGVGGFLELSFVRTMQGGGITRPRYGLEFLGEDFPSQVGEIRGGAVAVEPGALGANFVGVVFLAIGTELDTIQGAIEDTFNFVGGRIYGGHVFVAAGTVNFFGCNFWDSALVLPLTDQISIGGDVLVVAGNVFFTGCIFTATLLFGNFGGLGFNVGVLGGNMVMTFCVIQAQGVAEAAHGAGQVLFVGGGTMILTGVDFRFASACLLFTGIGDFFVGGGVMVFTGVTIENTYPILAAYGAGFYLAVGGGVMVETGVTYVQFNAPAHLALTGASIFTGAGVTIHTGVPASFYGTTVMFSGQGGFSYSGASYSMWLGCPIAIFAATFAFYGLGGVMSQPAGFTVYIGNPKFVPAALVYFAGLGVVMYLGAGGAVIGGSPVFAPAFKFFASGSDANYYVQGATTYANGIGYFDTNNPDGKGNLFEKEKNKTRMLSEKESFNGAIRKLKQTRSLSVSSVNRALSEFGSFTMDGSNQFIAADLDYKPTLDSFLPDKEGWVPPAILAAARDIENMKNKFPALANGMRQRGLAGEMKVVETRPTLEMASVDINNCQVCGEDVSITGEHADQCTSYASCEEMKQANPEYEPIFDFAEMSFDPWYIVQGTMNPASDKPMEVELFRDSLRAYFNGPAEMSGVQVTAYSTEPDPLFKEMLSGLPGKAASKLVDGTHKESTPMKVAFLTNDKAQAAALKKALNEPESEEATEMLAYVADHMAADGVDVAGLDTAHEKDVYIPAYNTPEFAKAFQEEATAAAGSNAVMLVQPGKEGMPMSHAAHGETYTVMLANFPKATDLTVTLIGSEGGKQTATGLGAATTDAKGMATLAWSVPASAAAGTYYIRAADKTGVIFGMSPAIDITPVARRKLYGPLMEL